MTVEELMKDAVAYRHFMNASGGGVTASGGEAILQAEFVRDWFRACHAEGINTCPDTNGFVRRYDPVIDELLDTTDLVMLDLKQMNDEIHQNPVGVSNHRTLEFARYRRNATSAPDPLRGGAGLVRRRQVGAPAGRVHQRHDQYRENRAAALPRAGQAQMGGDGEEYKLDGVHPPKAETMDRVKGIPESYGHKVIY